MGSEKQHRNENYSNLKDFLIAKSEI